MKVTFQNNLSASHSRSHLVQRKNIAPQQKRTFFTSPFVLKDIKEHSFSFNEFFSYLATPDGRYVKSNEGFSWVTSSPHLQQIMKTHFEDIDKTFVIKKNTQDIVKKTISISSTSKDVPYQQLPLVTNVSAGGLPALWSAFLQSILFRDGFFGPDAVPPLFVMPPNFKNSAAFGSSTQFHVSHASPMYTDSEFSVFNILKKTIKRTLALTEDSPQKDNYMIGEIHPAALLDLEVIKVGLGYLYHELEYKLCSSLGLSTILEETIPLAIESGKIMDNIQSDIGQALLMRRDTVRIAYNEAETKELLELQGYLKKYQIEATVLSVDEAEKLTGSRPHFGKGGSVWSIKGDGNVVPNIVELLMQAIERNGGKVIEGWIEQAFYDPEKKHLCAIEVVNQSNDVKTQTFVHTHNLFTSFGALARYSQKGIVADFKAVEPIIPGTGFSGFLLVQGEITKPIDSNNSHFTPLKTAVLEKGEKVTLIKATCGGAIGTTAFCKDHAINNLFYATNIVFPGKKIEILAAKSCNRPLNSKNSGKLQEVIPGFWAGTGFGGKGITDAAAFALKYVTPNLVKHWGEEEKLATFQEKLLKSSKNENESNIAYGLK